MRPFGHLPEQSEQPISTPAISSVANKVASEINSGISKVLAAGSALDKYKARNPLNADLVKMIQEKIKERKSLRPQEAVVLNETDLYQTLTNNLNDEELKAELENLDLKKHQAFFCKMFNAFREGILYAKPGELSKDKQLEELAEILRAEPLPNYARMVELMRQYPVIQQYNLFEYQDGIGPSGQVNTPFVHIKPHRFDASIPALKSHSVRIYLSPKLTALPQLCDDLLAYAFNNKFPLYFKTLDLSVNKPIKEAFTRLDRVIIFTDDEHLPKLLEFLENYHQQHSDSFTDKNLPLGITIKKGISLTPELNKEQKERAPLQKSFNSYRAKMLDEICQITMREMLKDPQISSVKPRRKRTIKTIFEDFLAAGFEKFENKNQSAKTNPEFAKLLSDLARNDYHSPKLTQYNYIIERALRQTFSDILPNIKPESVAEAFQASYSLIHRKYLTDPANIGFNQ